MIFRDFCPFPEIILCLWKKPVFGKNIFKWFVKTCLPPSVTASDNFSCRDTAATQILFCRDTAGHKIFSAATMPDVCGHAGGVSCLTEVFILLNFNSYTLEIFSFNNSAFLFTLVS